MQVFKNGQQVQKIRYPSEYTTGRIGIVLDTDTSEKKGRRYLINWQREADGTAINKKGWQPAANLAKIGEDLNKSEPKQEAIVKQPDLFVNEKLQRLATIALAAFNGAGAVTVTFLQGDDIYFVRPEGDLLQQICQLICEDVQRKRFMPQEQKTTSRKGGQQL
jgi:hypothetical protein